MMPIQESIFLLAEQREQPMHVGGLQLFHPPEGAGPDYLRELYEWLLQQKELAPLYRRRPYRSPRTLGQWSWREDDELDLEHHLRHSALPRPGRIRELLALTSRLHSTLLDRQRPLWEAHLIEGLTDGRYAIYTKMHHALIDGVSALRTLERSLSSDPNERDMLPPWAPRPRRGKRKGDGGGLLSLPRTALRTGTDLVGLGPATLKRAVTQVLNQQVATLPVQAPRTILNVPITGSRRVAAQSWPLARFRAIADASEATLNDVLLAVCSGALRRYLLEQDALPDSPLIAMTPVSLRRGDDDDEASGVSVGTILANLATHIPDPADRLTAIHRSMVAGKEAMRGLSQLQVTALSALVIAPLGLQALLDKGAISRPPYNVVISNVPGPQQPLYFNGAQMSGMYPLSIPTHGQALNITVVSYNGNFEFGLVGCRRSVPHLQRLLGHLDESLEELEKAVEV